MSNLLKFPPSWETKRQQFDWLDDFLGDQSDLMWVDTVTDTGTALVGDAVGGIMVLTPSDGTVGDNDEVYLATANELFKFAADKPFAGGARIQFTETAAGIYNCFVGFVNAVGADTMLDNGGGMKVSGSTAAIYKIDGSGQTFWKCVTANNGTSTVSTSLTPIGGASYQDLEVEVLPFSSTQVKAVFRVDGVPMKDSTTGLDIVHTVTVASATEMQFGMGAKLGAVTNNDVLNVDAAWFAGIRANL